MLTISIVLAPIARAQTGVGADYHEDGSVTLSCYDLAANRSVSCSERELAFHTGVSISRVFKARNYARLDQLFGQWCTGQDRFADGRWKLEALVEGLGQALRDAPTVQLKRIGEWQAQSPDSVAARLSEALYWHTQAWSLRRWRDFESPQKEVLQLFAERARKSLMALRPLMKAPNACPATQALWIEALIDTGAPEKDVERAYVDATARSGQYHGLHSAMARHFSPNYGGTRASFDAFARTAALLTRDFEGMGLYARLYAAVDTDQGIPFVAGASRPPFWSDLKAGYQDLRQRYPDSLSILVRFTSVACRTTDSDLYRSLREQLVGHEGEFEGPEAIDVCDHRHRWAPLRL